MSMVKKIKLVLLASAVMLSSKSVYAMEDLENGSHVPPHRQTVLPDNSSKIDPTKELHRQNAMIPENLSMVSVPSSNQPIGSLTVMSPLNDEIKKIIFDVSGRHLVEIDDKNQKKMQGAIVRVNATELSSRLETIQRALLEKLVDRKPFQGEIRPLDTTIAKGCYKLIAKALTLSQHQIIKRGAAIKEMVDKLSTYDATPIPGAVTQQKPKYFSKLYDSFDLIIYALTLKASQINSRTRAIQRHIDYLLPQKSHDRRDALQSLFKLKTKEIEERGILMKTYQVGQATAFFSPTPMQHTFNNSKTLLAASRLSNAELTRRLEKLDTLIGDPKFTLNFYKTEVQSNAFGLNSNDFISHLCTIQQNMSILLEHLNADGYLNTIAKALTLPPDQINARLATTKQYKELLNWQDHGLLEYNVDEIYNIAKKEHYRKYFMNDYLPKLGEEFQKRNQSSFTDDQLLLLLFPDHSTFDFSSDKARPKLSQFGLPYGDMFNPPPLEQPQTNQEANEWPSVQ